MTFCVFEKIRLPRGARLSTAWSPSAAGDVALLDRVDARATGGSDDSVFAAVVLPRCGWRCGSRERDGSRTCQLGFVCLLMPKRAAGSMVVVLRLRDGASFADHAQAHRRCWRSSRCGSQFRTSRGPQRRRARPWNQRACRRHTPQPADLHDALTAIRRDERLTDTASFAWTTIHREWIVLRVSS
jgi:hypothetical protein